MPVMALNSGCKTLPLSLRGRQRCCTMQRTRRQRMVCQASLMSKYQYEKRCAYLEEAYGIHVKDFGGRVLRQGQSGADVLALQEFLSEESYLFASPYDSFKVVNGYFGSMTKEALQSWQRDVGLQPTGIFDFTSKMMYTQYMEDKVSIPKAALDGVRVGISANGSMMPHTGRIPVHVYGIVGFVAVCGVLVATRMNHLKRYLSTLMPSTSPKRTVKNTPKVSDAGKPKPKRLSREELDMRLAPMRNIEHTRPKRATGGPVPHRKSTASSSASSRRHAATDVRHDHHAPEDGIQTRHGTYYGGRHVWNTIRRGVGENKGVSMPVAKQENMEQLGYRMSPSASGGPDDTHAYLLEGTELGSSPQEDGKKPVPVEKPGENLDEVENVVMQDPTTVILQDKPVKLHKPSRLMR